MFVINATHTVLAVLVALPRPLHRMMINLWVLVCIFDFFLEWTFLQVIWIVLGRTITNEALMIMYWKWITFGRTIANDTLMVVYWKWIASLTHKQKPYGSFLFLFLSSNVLKFEGYPYPKVNLPIDSRFSHFRINVTLF